MFWDVGTRLHVLDANLGKNIIYLPKESFYQKTTFKNIEKLMLPSPEAVWFDSKHHYLKGNGRKFQNLTERKYLIKYYIIQKDFSLKWAIFSYHHFFFTIKNTPSCLFKYFESFDVIAVKKKYRNIFCLLITRKYSDLCLK